MTTLHSVPAQANDSNGNFEDNLKISHVGQGGNAGGGAYKYSYCNDSVLAPDGGNMTVNVTDGDSPENNTRYYVYSYTSTSPRITSPNPPVSKTATFIEFALNLTPHELAFLAIIIWDAKNDVLFSCDPQVGNDPETVPR
ncbi:MAG: hypothetical protein H0T88_11700 [Lysobacter sp.]|nr:hypothetical protein [Lysobacter sp.]